MCLHTKIKGPSCVYKDKGSIICLNTKIRDPTYVYIQRHWVHHVFIYNDKGSIVFTYNDKGPLCIYIQR